MNQKEELKDKYIKLIKYDRLIYNGISNFKKNIDREKFNNFYKNPKTEILKDLNLIEKELGISNYLESEELEIIFDKLNLDNRRCALLYLKTEGNLAVSKYKEVKELEKLTNSKKNIYKDYNINISYFNELIEKILDQYISVRWGVLDSKKTSIAIKTIDAIEQSFEEPSKKLNQIVKEAGESMLKCLPEDIEFAKKVEKRNLLRESSSDDLQQLIEKVNSKIDNSSKEELEDDDYKKLKKYHNWIKKITKIESNNYAAYEALGKIENYSKNKDERYKLFGLEKLNMDSSSISFVIDEGEKYEKRIAYGAGYLYSLKNKEKVLIENLKNENSLKSLVEILNENNEVYGSLKEEYLDFKDNLDKKEFEEIKKMNKYYIQKIKSLHNRINEKSIKLGIKYLKKLDLKSGELILETTIGKNWKKELKDRDDWDDKSSVKLIQKMNKTIDDLGFSKHFWEKIAQLLPQPLEDVLICSIDKERKPKYILKDKKYCNREEIYHKGTYFLPEDEKYKLFRNIVKSIYKIEPNYLQLDNIEDYLGKNGTKMLFKKLAEKSFKENNFELGWKYLRTKEKKIENKKDGFIASKFMRKNLGYKIKVNKQAKRVVKKYSTLELDEILNENKKIYNNFPSENETSIELTEDEVKKLKGDYYKININNDKKKFKILEGVNNGEKKSYLVLEGSLEDIFDEYEEEEKEECDIEKELEELFGE